MAIITGIPGLEVKVMVNGEPAEEYLDEDYEESEKTITRYIEATSGAQFTVKCTFEKPFQKEKTDIRFGYYVDGNAVGGHAIRESSNRKSTTITSQMKGLDTIEDGIDVVKPLFFSDLSLDEHNENISEKNMFKSIGEVRVCVHRGIASPSRMSHPDRSFNSVDKVPEKALKGQALSHQARLGEAQMRKPSPLYHFDYQNGRDNPDASFVFRYRSRDALQAEHIIPRTPPPTPLEDRLLEELTTEELRNIIRRQRERSVAQTATKREIKQETKRERVSDDDSDLEITQVRSRKRQRISTSAEVIDLCRD